MNFRSAVPGAETTLSGGVHLPPALFKAWAGHPGMVEADLSALPQTLNWGNMGAGGGNGGNCTQFTKARLVWPRATESLSLTLFSLIWTPECGQELAACETTLSPSSRLVFRNQSQVHLVRAGN